MDSQQTTAAAIDGLMSAVKQVQRHTQARRGHPVWVAAHFAFGGLASTAFIAVILCRLAGHQIGDELTDKYVFSLVTSVLLFAVGTLMIEQLKGDLFGGFLGRSLAGCGLFVMSAQGYEFMQQTRACEVQHDLLAREKAKPVSETTFVALRSIELANGMCVEWEHENGRSRPVSVTNRRTFAGGNRVQSSLADDDRESRRIDCLPGRAPGGAASANGNDETF